MNFYHVIYIQSDGANGDQYVSASTEDNAAAAAQAADLTWTQLVSIETIAENVTQGS